MVERETVIGFDFIKEHCKTIGDLIKLDSEVRNEA